MTLRFLADENVPSAVVMAIRRDGQDVAWIREDAPGSSDLDVLARTLSESRVLLTFDKDFGELARGQMTSETSGIVLIRMPLRPDRDAGEALARIILARHDWGGHFAVIEPGRVRMRPLRVESRD